ncbi:ATP-binding cassette domain-containing protein [Priestia megaterium]|nr:ATP-binding cassette domain-containing protein [Priestia megaterium]
MLLKAQDIIVCTGSKGDEEIILRALNIDLKQEEIIGIKGVRLSGKSTLAAVLSGYLEPESGQVTIQPTTNISRGLVSLNNKLGKPSLFKKLLKKQGEFYTSLTELKFQLPNLLVIDDADNYPEKELKEIINQRTKSNNLTVLLSSDFDLIDRLCNQSYRLEYGRLVKE